MRPIDRRARLRRNAIESLESRRLLTAPLFPGEGPTVGDLPKAVVVADFNGDGKPDLATANSNANTASVVLGQGDGGFGAAVTLPVGSGPSGIAAGDFNNDGKSDLAVANANANTVSVALGNGDGTFAAATTLTVGSSPVAIAVADLNGDTHPDLVVANSGSGNVTVLLGNGGGTFAASNVSVGGLPTAVTGGDFNGDGKTDLAVTRGGAGNTVAVLAGNGNGTFGAATAFIVGTSPDSVVAGDFNEDGKTDLAVASYPSSALSVLIGSGAGTFASAAALSTASNPASVVTADFNADGHADLATLNTNNTISVLLGSGAGTFATQSAYYVGVSESIVSSRLLAAADFNGDGNVDLAAANSPTFYGVVAVLLGNGNGTFVGTLAATAAGTPVSGATADFNGDSVPDVATVNSNGTSLSVLIGTGDGAFTVTSREVGGQSDVTTGDFNGDGKIDLALAGGSVSILPGNGDGTFGTAISVPAAAASGSILSGDFNGDGRADLATLNGAAGSVSVLLGNGSNGFTAAAAFTPGGSIYAFAASDINRDGKPDLAVLESYNNSNGAIAVLLNNGNGTFYAAGPVLVPFGSSAGVICVDLNNDNKPDLVTTFGPSGAADPGRVAVALGGGDGSFGSAGSYPAGYSPRGLVAADFDADGRPDLATTNFDRGTITLLHGNGNGTFAAFTTAAAASGPGYNVHSLLAADFNRDGRPDLVSVGHGSGANVSTLLNRPTGVQLGVGGGTVTLSGSGPVTINIAGGTLSVTTPAGTRQVAATSITNVVLSGVTVAINNDLGPATGNGAVNLTVGIGASAALHTSQHLAGLTVNGPAAFAAGGGKVLRTPALSIGAIGTLDLADNDLVYDYSGTTAQQSTIRAAIRTARANGAWTGYGLTSGTAKKRPAGDTTLGYLESSDYKSFAGAGATFASETIDGTAVLVRYTYYGDTDLDRGVSINDFNRLSSSFGVASGRFWFNGDFDNDGGVSINDFNLLSTNFGKTLPAAAPLPAVKRGVAPAKH